MVTYAGEDMDALGSVTDWPVDAAAVGVVRLGPGGLGPTVDHR